MISMRAPEISFTWWRLIEVNFATLRSAMFGFFSTVAQTLGHMPHLIGTTWLAEALSCLITAMRGLRINWLIVGMVSTLCYICFW